MNHQSVSKEISIDDAWALCQSRPEIQEDFLVQASIFNWKSPYNLFERGPHWAYWFARHVICNRWKNAEELIETDETVAKWYKQLLLLYGVLGIAYEVRKPISARKPTPPRYDDVQQISDHINDLINQQQLERKSLKKAGFK